MVSGADVIAALFTSLLASDTFADEEASELISMIAGRGSNASTMVSTGQLAALLSSISCRDDIAPTRQQLFAHRCQALVHILRHADNIDASAAAAGIGSLAAALGLHLEHEAVMTPACESVALLARLATREMAGEAAAPCVAALVSVLQRHVANVPVAMFCCRALGLLTGQCNASDALAAAGGVSAVLAAFRTHVADAGAAQACCECVRVLASVPGLRAAIVAGGGMSLLGAALAAHAAHGDVAPVVARAQCLLTDVG